MILKQGKPYGPNQAYPVHLRDTSPETVKRDRDLGNTCIPIICHNGQWHRWVTSDISEVTCELCKQIGGAQ